MADITAPPLLIRPKATDGTLQFYWYSPANIGTGASFVSTYTITLTDASGGFPVPSTLTVNTPFATYAGYTTAILSSMTNGIKYTYGITAQNDLRFSSPTTLFRRVAPGFKPQAVASVGAYPRSATSALVAWASSGVVATPPIEWFVAKAISSNGGDPILARSQYPFMSNVVISSLNTASQYRFYVYAVNDPGYSIPVFTPYLAIPNVNSSDLIVYLSAESYPGYGAWPDRSGNGYNAVIENGTNLTITDSGLGLSQQFGQQQSALATTQVTSGQKAMYSVQITSEVGNSNYNRCGMGWGLSTMNYEGYPPYAWDGYPGNDLSSFGVLGGGILQYQSTTVQSGLPTFGISGDVIDVAIYDGVGWWIRVNNGLWNNDSSADPVTNVSSLSTFGLTGLFPAGCPGAWTQAGSCILIDRPSSNIPSGYTFL